MKKLVLVMTIALIGFSAFAQNTDVLVNHYVQVKNALVNSDGKLAAAAIVKLYEGIKSEAEFAQQPGLLKAAEKLRQAGNDIDKQRAAFNDVSALVWKLVKASDNAGQAVYYQYCPMKKSYWLSTEKDIQNPYYGSAMLTCGRVEDSKPASQN